MKKILSSIALLCILSSSYAQSGYKIKVKFKQDVPDSVVYLARYFAKALPNVYLIDSSKVVNKREISFKTDKKILGGLHLILFQNKSKWMDVVLDNGYDMQIDLDNNSIYKGSVIKGSVDNVENAKFQVEAEAYGLRAKELNNQLAKATTKEDSTKVHDLIKINNDEFLAKRRALAADNKSGLLAKLFNALERPQPPAGPHFLEDGVTIDSFFNYYYIKKHFWDKFDFADDRLIHAPIYDGKLKDYFDNYTLAIPDTFNMEADQLLAKMDPKSELFKYTLHFLGNYTRAHKIMGMDESFVYLVENYFMKGYGHWLNDKQLKELYTDPAQKIAPNVIGNPAPELELQDAYTIAPKKLSEYDAPYTLLIFWDVSCGHCEKEIPHIDSLYNSYLKDKGVRIFSVVKGKELGEIHNKIDKLKVKHWSHHIDKDANSGFMEKYNVYSTPVMYILDKDKKIRGKNFNHETVIGLFDYIRKKDESKKS